jgi:hypothetical protein
MASSKDAFKKTSSASLQEVSTTNRKAGGWIFGRGRLYSTVVKLGMSSAGRLSSEISW